MVLAQESKTDWVELATKENITVHFGMISFKLSTDEFITVASMFDLSSGMEMPDESLCSIHRLEDGTFQFFYKGMQLPLCPKALVRMSKLLGAANRELTLLFKEPAPVASAAMDEIDQILMDIEQRNRDL